jgi:hypothetical protein
MNHDRIERSMRSSVAVAAAKGCLCSDGTTDVVIPRSAAMLVEEEQGEKVLPIKTMIGDCRLCGNM